METGPVRAEQAGDFLRMFFRSMGFDIPKTVFERACRDFEPERSLAATDRDQIVGTTYSHLFELTLPGGDPVPAAGVTAVGVAATHRRRGIVRDLMHRQLEEARGRGEPLAILIASESVIYGRFGYGLSSSLMDYEIDPRDAAFLDPAPAPGRVSFVTPETADKRFPELHDRWRRSRPGALGRPGSFWAGISEDRTGKEQHVLYESGSGEAEGYAVYTVEARWEAGLPDHKLRVGELIALTAEGYRALWRHLLDVDLVRTVAIGARPPDEPLRWLLGNPRALRVTRFGDFIWTRLLDVPRVLSARRYSAPGTVVLDVDDHFLPEVGGRFRLDMAEASCEATDEPADLSLAVRDLGAVVLGGTSLAELASAGRVVEHRPGAVREADAGFRWSPLPWSATWF